MGVIASLITSLTIVYSTVYSDADQRKHQSSASLAFVWGSHRGPVNSPHKWPVTRKMFPFDDVIMIAFESWKSAQQSPKYVPGQFGSIRPLILGPTGLRSHDFHTPESTSDVPVNQVLKSRSINFLRKWQKKSKFFLNKKLMKKIWNRNQNSNCMGFWSILLCTYK